LSNVASRCTESFYPAFKKKAIITQEQIKGVYHKMLYLGHAPLHPPFTFFYKLLTHFNKPAKLVLHLPLMIWRQHTERTRIRREEDPGMQRGMNLHTKVMVVVLLMSLTGYGCGGGGSNTDGDSSAGISDLFTFGTPVDLLPTFNEGGCDFSPNLPADGLELFFACSGPGAGGAGGHDLWVTRRATLDDPFGPPESLGPTVNSANDDIGPNLFADGLTLFFNSSRPGGAG
jgi:hypothetical protein